MLNYDDFDAMIESSPVVYYLAQSNMFVLRLIKLKECPQNCPNSVMTTTTRADSIPNSFINNNERYIRIKLLSESSISHIHVATTFQAHYIWLTTRR